MAHGRIETTPEQQLAELRLAYARYSTLAQWWKDSADPRIDDTERQWREQDARRIAHAYEKSIASTTLRLESLHNTELPPGRFTPLAKGLSVMLAAAILSSGAAIAYLRPEIFPQLLTRGLDYVAPTRTLPVPRVAAPRPQPRPASARPESASPESAKPESMRDARAGRAPVAAPVKTPAPLKALAPARPSPRQAPTPTRPVVIARAPAPSPAPAVAAEEAQTRALNRANAPAATPLLTAAIKPPTAPAAIDPLPSPVLQEPAAPQPSPTRLVPVLRTHLLPPYPFDAKKAGEHGTTQMEVSISPLGAITACRVTETSGSQRLDDTACSFVQRYWRWLPPTRDGQQVPATTKLSVIWNLVAAK